MDEILKYIEESTFFSKYMRKTHWWVSTTCVYPIQCWHNHNGEGVHEIELQLDGSSCKQWQERMLKKLSAEIADKFGVTITDVFVVRNDGSCPDEGRIYVKP